MTEEELYEALQEIEKAQQLAGFQPRPEDLDRARRVLLGELTEEEGLREVFAQFGVTR